MRHGRPPYIVYGARTIPYILSAYIIVYVHSAHMYICMRKDKTIKIVYLQSRSSLAEFAFAYSLICALILR